MIVRIHHGLYCIFVSIESYDSNLEPLRSFGESIEIMNNKTTVIQDTLPVNWGKILSQPTENNTDTTEKLGYQPIVLISPIFLVIGLKLFHLKKN